MLIASLLLVAAGSAPAAAGPPAADPAAPRPRMVLEPMVFDAGTVTRGTPVNAVFTVRNAGSEVLRLKSVHPG